MNKRAVFVLVAANLVVLLLIAVVWPEHMVAPGQVMPAHRAFATDCFACHQPFIGSTPGQCVKCHKPAEIGLVTTKGVSIADELKFPPFHQDLTEQDCVACHSDHKGVQAFHPIGRFSHELLKVARRDQCSGCHQAPLDSMHQGVVGNVGNCGQCHVQEAWTPATFDHKGLFSLTGDHQATCNTCHVGNDYSRYTCYGCHEHTRSGIREEHLEEGIRDYENCVECHRGGDAEDAEHADGRREGREADEGDDRADQHSREEHDSDEQDDDDD